MDQQDTIDAASAAASAGLKGTLFGGASMAWGGWTANDVAVLIGAVVAVCGLIVQIHFKRKEYRLRVREHEMRVREHEATMDGLTSHLEDGR